MVAVPAATPVTTPSSTLATAVSSEDHDTVSPSGTVVAVSVTVEFAATVSVSLLSVTLGGVVTVTAHVPV